MSYDSFRDLADSLRDDLTNLAMDVDVLANRFKALLVEMPRVVERLERDIEQIKSRP